MPELYSIHKAERHGERAVLAAMQLASMACLEDASCFKAALLTQEEPPSPCSLLPQAATGHHNH